MSLPSPSLNHVPQSRGISALVNDTLIEGIMNLGAAIVGLLCSVIGYLYAREMGLSKPNMAVLGVSGAFIGAALALVVATVIESAVCTTFVCFAENPQSLEIRHPELSDDLVAAWEDVLQGPLSTMRSPVGSSRGRSSSASSSYVSFPPTKDELDLSKSQTGGLMTDSGIFGRSSNSSNKPPMKSSPALDVSEGKDGGESEGRDEPEMTSSADPAMKGMEEGKFGSPDAE